MTPVSPFHRGEQELQLRLGMRDKMERLGRRMIRDHMPEEHREFFSQLPLLLVGTVDASGRPWASVLAGKPGFLDPIDARTPGSPGAAHLRRPARQRAR